MYINGYLGSESNTKLCKELVMLYGSLGVNEINYTLMVYACSKVGTLLPC